MVKKDKKPNFKVGDRVLGVGFGKGTWTDLQGQKATMTKIWNDNTYLTDEDCWVVDVKWHKENLNNRKINMEHWNPTCFKKIKPRSLKEFINENT